MLQQAEGGAGQVGGGGERGKRRWIQMIKIEMCFIKEERETPKRLTWKGRVVWSISKNIYRLENNF